MGRAVERVERFCLGQRRTIDRVEKSLLQTGARARRSRGGEVVCAEHPLNGIEAVEAGRIEGRADEAAGVAA